jgi:hypothetical protein
MKRRFFNIAGALAVLLAAGLIVSVSLTLAGCGDKDSGDPTSPTNPSNPSSGSHDSALVARWYLKYPPETNMEDMLIYEFRADGTFLYRGMGGFTFSTSGGTFTIVLGGQMEAGSANYKINGTALTLSNVSGFYLMSGTYYKK